MKNLDHDNHVKKYRKRQSVLSVIRKIRNKKGVNKNV